MLSTVIPLCRVQSRKAILQIHVHPREDLERVRMAQPTSVLLLSKAMRYLQWGSEKLTDTRAAPRGLAWYRHLLATEEFPPWLLEASGFFEEIFLTYPSVLRPCLIKWDWSFDEVVWFCGRCFGIRLTGVLIPFLSLAGCLTSEVTKQFWACFLICETAIANLWGGGNGYKWKLWHF